MLSGSTLEEMATSAGVTVSTDNVNYGQSTISGGGGVENAVIGEVFSMADGAISQPIAGKNALYVIQLEAFTEGEITDADITSKKATATAGVQARARDMYTALKEAAGVEDNRLYTK